MAIPWLNRIRRTGQLTVHNKARTWSVAVDAAIARFNTLGLGVKLVKEKEEKSANVVVTLSDGSEVYPYYGDTATAKFDASIMHGQTSTLVDEKRNQIFFAVIFLPGKVANVTAEQKEVMTIHELIHACGLNGRSAEGKNDANQDHDTVGIMVANMKADGKGLIEYMPAKGAKAMPPVRVGAQTLCRLRAIWTDKGCQED